jgi:hypothetical protein
MKDGHDPMGRNETSRGSLQATIQVQKQHAAARSASVSSSRLIRCRWGWHALCYFVGIVRAAKAAALRCAMASIEIIGFTPEALGNAEPSMT